MSELQTFFTTSSENTLALLKLNQALKRGDFPITLLSPQRDFSLRNQAAIKAQGYASYYDLLPLREGKVLEGYETTKWHILPFENYVHIATF
ncbi:MAG: hypothetical protein ACKVTZ_01040, partial [Bacteroidia bacterium]